MVQLSKLEERHLELSRQMMQADGGNLFPLDIYAIGSIKRSLAHCKGFATLIHTKNMTCAGGILRMQVDTLIRFYAAFIVEKPHDFAHAVMCGTQVKDLTDHNGRKMNDGYLVSMLSKQYPWLKSVYKETSGYVHFSSKHIFAAMKSLDEDDRTINFEISHEDVPRAEEVYQEAINAFYHITQIFLLYVEGWVQTKDQKITASMKADQSTAAPA